MACQIEQIADCGDISTIARALFINDKDDSNWLLQCVVSISSCGSLLAVGYKSRLCLLTNQWIKSTESNTYVISWSGTLPSDVTALLALPICPAQQSSQNGPDWFCIIVGSANGHISFYTNTGHLLLSEKLDDGPVLNVRCHTGTYGTMPDDINVLMENCDCIIAGQSLFQTLRYAKAQLARVQAGLQSDYTVDSRSLNIRKWTFSTQETINDAVMVGLEVRNTYDYLLAASTYGGYDVWYRSSVPTQWSVVGVGGSYVSLHAAVDGGLQPGIDHVARALATKIKSALPGWLGGGSEPTPPESKVRSESLSISGSIKDAGRSGLSVVLSADRRLAAVTDCYGRVAVIELGRGQVVKLFKGYRDAQCAFIQVFEHDGKKLHLSTIKDTRRANFLIIYTPKKGLVDIRLLKRGNRVATFTATKNGRLLYNTCGLVGAEQTYTQKKLNLPEYQCLLMDSDGKIKRFNIPFFFALEGEHSDRSKDLHILRDLKEQLKQGNDNVKDILDKVVDIKTTDLKKHCLEMLIRNHNIAPDTVMAVLSLFWDGVVNIEDEVLNNSVKDYFHNLLLITLFYRRINNEDINDMKELVEKVNIDFVEEEMKESEKREFGLLEDDNCILERLLIMAQEKDYKEYHHARVKFADDLNSAYKDFVACFQLNKTNEGDYVVALKPEISLEKLTNLAAFTFKSIIKLDDLKSITKFIKESRIEAKEIIKLVVIHIMNMSLDDISIDLIVNIIAVVYYISLASEDACQIVYNEVSDWWQGVRDELVDMPCPLRSMIVAMICKAAAKTHESTIDDDAWESVSTENAKWGLLIGKLEDISILSIVLSLKETYKGDHLPKLFTTEMDINLKYIYTRGKGSVTELISKWLCGMGVKPEAIIANEILDRNENEAKDDDEDTQDLFLEQYRVYVDDNPNIFKWISLLRQQFPHSTSSNNIIANMSWEYALAWQKNIQDLEKLNAVLNCIKNIKDPHLSAGMCMIVWTTYIKDVFERSCVLVNKVGKLPKEILCLQDVGLKDTHIVKFLQITNDYLDLFMRKTSEALTTHRHEILYEKIWDDNSHSLIEVAQDNKPVDSNSLNLNYQISCTIFYLCHFNIKVTKPMNNLFDVDYHDIFESLSGKRHIKIGKPSEKVKNPRLKFMNKLVRAALETISCDENEGPCRRYNTVECVMWMDRIYRLAGLWEVSADFILGQQVIGLFHMGHDALMEDYLRSVQDVEPLLGAIEALATQRLKRHLSQAADPADCVAALPPLLASRVTSLEQDHSVGYSSPAATLSSLQAVWRRVPTSARHKRGTDMELLIAGYNTLQELQL